MRKIFTRTAEIKLISNNIIKISLIKEIEMEENDVVENYLACEKLTKGKKYSYIVNGNNFSSSAAAKAFATRLKSSNGIIAEAFICSSFTNKLLGNFYIKLNKPTVPTKIFTKEINAIKWLRNLQKQ